MTIDASTLDLAELNRCTADEFAALLGGILENADFLVRRAAGSRPFADLAALHGTLLAQIEALSEADLVLFLSGHPELAGPEARGGTMTAHSTLEQGRLNLGSLSDSEASRWYELNGRYRARFGFPFIIRVAEHDYGSLLASFEHRLGNDRQSELRVALSEIAKISRHRLLSRMGRARANLATG